MDSGWVTKTLEHKGTKAFVYYIISIETIRFRKSETATLATTPPTPQKAVVIIFGHDITTTPMVPPRLQPLSAYKQSPKETDRKEQNNIVGVVVVVEGNWTFIFRHFETLFCAMLWCY
jgi:hypothetical protein